MNEIVIQITSVTKRCITRYLILTNLRIQESDKIGMIEIRSLLLTDYDSLLGRNSWNTTAQHSFLLDALTMQGKKTRNH
jgi:hypothetical protein